MAYVNGDENVQLETTEEVSVAEFFGFPVQTGNIIKKEDFGSQEGDDIVTNIEQGVEDGI